MRILDFLVEDAIKINLEAKSKEEVIKELVKLLKEAEKSVMKRKRCKFRWREKSLEDTGVDRGLQFHMVKLLQCLIWFLHLVYLKKVWILMP